MKICVDIVIVASGHVLLIRRAKEPFMDKLVLPGGKFEESDQSLVTAAAREAWEEVGLCLKPDTLRLLTVLDAKGADPRPGMRVAIAYLVELADLSELAEAKAGSDAREVVLMPLAAIEPEMIGFDHYQAIQSARKVVIS